MLLRTILIKNANKYTQQQVFSILNRSNLGISCGIVP